MPLVTSTEMFKKAYDGGYAIGAFNVNNMEIIQGITEAARDLNAPLILQVSKGARAYANHTYLVKLVEAAAIECPNIPIVLHLDHGPDFETCKSCIDGGFTSVMIDASSKPFQENIEITKKVVEYAHDHGVVVEAELGALAGIEDDVKVSAEESHYTHPEEVEEFVSKTGCDSLAIAIGTSHGAYKFTADQCTRNEKGELVPPPLRFDILEEVTKRLPGFPIVLHGSSSVPQNFVKMINENGGKMPDAVGIPEEQLRQAARSAVCKINIDSDLRLAMTGTIRQFFNDHPDKFDPASTSSPPGPPSRSWSPTRSWTCWAATARHNFIQYDFQGAPSGAPVLREERIQLLVAAVPPLCGGQVSAFRLKCEHKEAMSHDIWRKAGPAAKGAGDEPGGPGPGAGGVPAGHLPLGAGRGGAGHRERAGGQPPVRGVHRLSAPGRV